MLSWEKQMVIATSVLAPACCQSIVDLSGSDWTVSSQSLNISVPGSLPSQAHLDLYAANVIGDPYYGLNDFNLRWVLYSNWTYTSAPITGLDKTKSTWLVFNGLDTFASIDFCETHVAATNNQFRQYHFDVSNILSNCSSAPALSLNFGSAPNIADAIASQPGQETWPYGVQGTFEFSNRWFIRKEQSDFGWDWGPAFAPAGPWLPAYIVQLDASQLYVRNTLVDIYRQGQLNNLPPDQSKPWVLNVSVDYFGTAPKTPNISYKLLDAQKGNVTVASGLLESVNKTESTITSSVQVPDGTVNLWWPTGLGNQNLYYLQLSISDGANNELATIEKRVGFRTIVVNEGVVTQEQLDQGIAPGNNWHFEVNGKTFYAKGSNFIPPDAFWPRVTPKRIEQLFQSVVDGRQNMLRVWSSGAYSPDFMYDIADEMGILLWSEFEFGDALYPVDEEFLANVRDEIDYQTRRVNHHPSLAFWAGGNELENLELALANESSPETFPKYQAEYEKLFLDTIVPVLFGNSKSISYSPSSTSNGWLSLNFSLPQPFVERYNNKTPGSIYGVTDYYNYDSSKAFNLSSYPVGRFSNEFGYHSMPSIQTWRQAVDESDLWFNSSVIQLRNHHYPSNNLNTSNFYNTSKGMGEMTIAAERWYPVPNKPDSIANFTAWCWTTQVFQADFYASQIQFYRRGSGLKERQLGCLYWQLEDIWQAPTWAGIEYDGRWKVLHYVAKDKYSNVIISPFYNQSTGDLQVWVTSDLWSPVNGTANITWYDLAGKKLDINPTSVPVTVGAINSTKVFEADVNTLLSNNTSIDKANLIAYLSVSVQGSLPNNDTIQTFTHQNWFHPLPLSQTKLVDPGLTVSFANDTKTFTVEATKGVAAWTWLDYPEGAVVTFDDNAFLLLPGEKREIGYTMKKDTTGGEWVKGVNVTSLWDNTTP